ncbi:9754_t:CDS:2 [Funneliformis mosseae]|uniref:9754_t:CDS:1 n=1 Tax=Funneliformis mosseae TaxID=27381 RepID=A0A9N9DCP3_FUNMO|nr:9754_t:CDS:2 [Funneliformis mosseae]
MFAKDALCLNFRTEPWWFRLIRRIFAITLLIVVGAYGSYQLTNFTMFINTANIVVIEPKTNVSFPGFVICPESNIPTFLEPTVEATEPPFSITCGKSKDIEPKLLNENVDFTDSICNKFIQKSSNGCFKFRPDKAENNNDEREEYADSILRERETIKPFVFFNIIPNDGLTPIEIPLFYTIYLDQYNGTEKNYSAEKDSGNFFQYHMQTIATGKRTIIEFSILVHRYFSTILMGQLSSRPDNTSVEVSVNQKSIPLRRPTSNGLPKTQFVFIPEKRYTREEMEDYQYQPISIVSRLGGFYGAITGIYIFLFGMSKVEPWGMFQKVVFRCWPCRRSFKKHLAASYVSAAGIPLGENINDRPKGTSLGDRLQVLECLLKDYYIDPYYLEILKLTKIRYDHNDARHNELENIVQVRDAIARNRQNEHYKRCVRRWSSLPRVFNFGLQHYNERSDSSLTATSPRKKFHRSGIGFLNQGVSNITLDEQLTPLRDQFSEDSDDTFEIITEK